MPMDSPSSETPDTTLNSTSMCTKHSKPVVGDLMQLPKLKIIGPVCEECIELLSRARQLHPHSRGIIQMRLFSGN